MVAGHSGRSYFSKFQRARGHGDALRFGAFGCSTVA
jgi:hypothetical protein